MTDALRSQGIGIGSVAVGPLLNTKQAAEADRASVAKGPSLLYLSQNAGAAVAREIVRRWSARPITVLCRPGGNGGNGFVVARLLAASRWPVGVASLGARDRLTSTLRKLADGCEGPVESITPASLDGGSWWLMRYSELVSTAR